MKKSKKIAEGKKPEIILIFSTVTEYVRLMANSVVYISGGGNYSTITTIDKSTYTLILQLGQIEQSISDIFDNEEENHFMRIGKSLIINRNYITLVNPSQKTLVLSDCRTFNFHLRPSTESLKKLKNYLETEE